MAASRNFMRGLLCLVLGVAGAQQCADTPNAFAGIDPGITENPVIPADCVGGLAGLTNPDIVSSLMASMSGKTSSDACAYTISELAGILQIAFDTLASSYGFAVSWNIPASFIASCGSASTSS